MTLQELSRLNEKFQQKASEMVDLIPGSNLMAFSSAIIRTAQKLDRVLNKVLGAKTEVSFYTQVDALEEEMDELIFMMDKLDDANRKRNIPILIDFVKRGYELLSLYSICCDQIIEQKTKAAKRKDEFERD
ncbi:hypothetical protein [Marinoscillum furvescens]|uniref:Uncharacterized protein n=1 Tax=Marinoscillum furvescens DSM 4134 TaxID=1122208 RepID=A0A3D9KWD4_MARFU|nr:hypothetical protein [Marinoscillum furvescens]RED92443.1 hypothetical protein C7460_13011 [Marinoscillum furvescens DSM 4134]